MTKKLVKILAMCVLTIMSLGLFAGCGKNEYNATILIDGYTFQQDFLKDNITRGSNYLDENDEVVVAEGESYPQYRVFNIKSQAESDVIFASFSANIDYEKEMLVLYTFTSYNPSPYEIDKIILEADTLKISYKYGKSQSNVDNTTSPIQKYLIVKMDKLDVEGIEFTKV